MTLPKKGKKPGAEKAMMFGKPQPFCENTIGKPCEANKRPSLHPLIGNVVVVTRMAAPSVGGNVQLSSWDRKQKSRFSDPS